MVIQFVKLFEIDSGKKEYRALQTQRKYNAKNTIVLDSVNA